MGHLLGGGNYEDDIQSHLFFIILKLFQQKLFSSPAFSLFPTSPSLSLTYPQSMTPFSSNSHILHQKPGLLTPPLCRWRVCPVNDKGGGGTSNLFPHELPFLPCAVLPAPTIRTSSRATPLTTRLLFSGRSTPGGGCLGAQAQLF
jgi:hypothetical protein